MNVIKKDKDINSCNYNYLNFFTKAPKICTENRATSSTMVFGKLDNNK